MSDAVLRVATRGSRLARWQAERVVARLGRPAELVVVSTEGDRRPDADLHAIGGAGVFVKDVQRAVLEGRADVAVHSAKDLPSTPTPGLVLGAVPERADPRDALVGARLDAVPTGGRIGTGSVRRRAQLAALRPDLTFGPLRGSIETRLDKASGFEAVVVAHAALERLGLAGRADEVLEPGQLLPQVAQGALAVECRADDEALVARLASIDDPDAHRAVDAERAFLARLGGGCDAPVGALGCVGRDGAVTLEGLVASLDGRVVLRARGVGAAPHAVGTELAESLLDRRGGRLVLEGAVP